MELQTDLKSPQVKDDIKIPTPMERQTEPGSPKCSDDMKIPTLIQVSLKFHGGGNFHILTLWRLELQTDLESPQG